MLDNINNSLLSNMKNAQIDFTQINNKDWFEEYLEPKLVKNLYETAWIIAKTTIKKE